MAAVTSGLAGGSFSEANPGVEDTNNTRTNAAIVILLGRGWLTFMVELALGGGWHSGTPRRVSVTV